MESFSNKIEDLSEAYDTHQGQYPIIFDLIAISGEIELTRNPDFVKSSGEKFMDIGSKIYTTFLPLELRKLSIELIGCWLALTLEKTQPKLI